MRRICERIDIIDLGGECRGTRKDGNVFAIQTPVAIFVAWRKKRKDDATEAKVRYTRIEGDRDDKLRALDEIRSFRSPKWQVVSNAGRASFKPTEKSEYSCWPLITDLFPWQQSGSQFKRLWPISPDREALKERWDYFVDMKNKVDLFKETRDRKISIQYPDLMSGKMLPPLETATKNDFPSLRQYSYRSFDRQFIIADNRVGDYLRPSLWTSHSENQIYLTGLFTTPLGQGPGLVICSEIPDMHHFSNRGAKDIIPLYRDKAGMENNIHPNLLKILGQEFSKKVDPLSAVGYIYAILAHPEYAARFEVELQERRVRVPISKNPELFFRAAEYGRYLVWLHTYGERMTGRDRPKGMIPKGTAKCLHAISDKEEFYPNEYCYDESTKMLQVGEGRFGPVEPNIFNFEVSGFKVVKSWLGYRMRERSGKKSSRLDEIRPRVWTYEFTRQLLELLWVLEKTVEGYPKQKKMLEEILAGDLFTAAEFPPVPESARKAPKSVYGDLEFPDEDC